MLVFMSEHPIVSVIALLIICNTLSVTIVETVKLLKGKGK